MTKNKWDDAQLTSSHYYMWLDTLTRASIGHADFCIHIGCDLPSHGPLLSAFVALADEFVFANATQQQAKDVQEEEAKAS